MEAYEFLTREAIELAVDCWLDFYHKDMQSRVEPNAQMAQLLLNHSKQCRRRAYRHARRALLYYQRSKQPTPYPLRLRFCEPRIEITAQFSQGDRQLQSPKAALHKAFKKAKITLWINET